MIDIKDRICDVVADKVMSAEASAEFVKDGDNLGVSGFTPSGYPKAVPLALAEKGKKTVVFLYVFCFMVYPPQLSLSRLR